MARRRSVVEVDGRSPRQPLVHVPGQGSGPRIDADDLHAALGPRFSKRKLIAGLAAVGATAGGGVALKKLRDKKKAEQAKAAAAPDEMESLRDYERRKRRRTAAGVALGGLGLGALGTAVGYRGGKRLFKQGIEEAEALGDFNLSRDMFRAFKDSGLSDDEAREAASAAVKMAPMAAGIGGGLLGGSVGLGTGAIGGGIAGSLSTNRKEASLAEYSVLFDKIADGDLGEEARQALYGVCQTIETSNIPTEKTASMYDASNLSEDDARKARLDQLLKR